MTNATAKKWPNGSIYHVDNYIMPVLVRIYSRAPLVATCRTPNAGVTVSAPIRLLYVAQWGDNGGGAALGTGKILNFPSFIPFIRPSIARKRRCIRGDSIFFSETAFHFYLVGLSSGGGGEGGFLLNN